MSQSAVRWSSVHALEKPDHPVGISINDKLAKSGRTPGFRFAQSGLRSAGTSAVSRMMADA
jgi:hypothetical protein